MKLYVVSANSLVVEQRVLEQLKFHRDLAAAKEEKKAFGQWVGLYEVEVEVREVKEAP